jgi:hypothetical protein
MKIYIYLFLTRGTPLYLTAEMMMKWKRRDDDGVEIIYYTSGKHLSYFTALHASEYMHHLEQETSITIKYAR